MEEDIFDGWKGFMNKFGRIYQDINEQTKRDNKKVVQFFQSGTEMG
jgi:beta-glucosidase/6-phospho-beta-glucosidase/beta-galactosidase